MTSRQTELDAGGLELAIDGEVATVTLARPERRNAMTPATWHGLAAVGASLPPEVRVVVVRGRGPSFCAGIDLRLFSENGIPGEAGIGNATHLEGTDLEGTDLEGTDLEGTDLEGTDLESAIAGYQAGYLWLRNPAIVSIAAVQGHAIGAGFQLALACDLRILADDATLCMKEPALGLVPDLTGTKPLVDIVGLPRAIELCLTTRTVTAPEALLLRLAELVVPPAELDAAVADLVAALIAVDASAARATKALLQQAGSHSLEEQAAAERHAQAALLRVRPELNAGS